MKFNVLVLILLPLIPFCLFAQELERYKPYYLAEIREGSFEVVIKEIKDKLKASNFQLVGEYSPVFNTLIL